MSQLSGLQRRGEELEHHHQHRGDHGHPHQVRQPGKKFMGDVEVLCISSKDGLQTVFLVNALRLYWAFTIMHSVHKLIFSIKIFSFIEAYFSFIDAASTRVTDSLSFCSEGSQPWRS